MKMETNNSGKLLVWLDDGTEIIFSDAMTNAVLEHGWCLIGKKLTESKVQK